MTNILFLFKLDGKITIHLYYFFVNLITIIFCQYKLDIQKEYELFIDCLILILHSIIIYFLRKIWEYKIREVYAEKIKFKNLYLYANDFLFGLNSFHLNFKNNHLLCYDENFYKFLNKNLQISNPNNNNSQIFAYSKSFSNLNDKPNSLNESQLKKIGATSRLKIESSNYYKCKEEKNFNYYIKEFDLNEFNPMTYFLKELKNYDNDEAKSMNIIRESNDTAILNNFNSIDEKILNSYENIKFNSFKENHDENEETKYNQNKLNLLEMIKMLFEKKKIIIILKMYILEFFLLI